VLRALAEHERDLEAYSARNRALIAAHAPESAANRDAYARRLLALTGTEARA
jgi:hypothetical protein